MSTEIVCLPVMPNGAVGGGWGKAQSVALAKVVEGELADWQVIDVGWGDLHDSGTHGSHHARIVKFLMEHEVTVVAAGHMGDGMQNTIGKMGLKLVLRIEGDARAAAVAAAG